MDALLHQLGLDKTFFVELAIFCVLFPLLCRVYFVPFLKLFELRHDKTVADQVEAEKLLAKAQEKEREYQRKLTSERVNLKKEFEKTVIEAKKRESEILTQARQRVKKISGDSAALALRQKQELSQASAPELAGLSQLLAEKLLSRKI